MKLTLVAIFCCLMFPLFGQGTFQGVVVDENRQPLIGARIVIKDNGGAVTDEHGKFRITNLRAGTYNAEVSFIGYIGQQQSIEISDNNTTELMIGLKTGSVQLSDITISAAQQNPVNTLSQIDIKLRPVNTSQDILRMVPGLFIAQHAGGGKAEQIFLRGFDADHGTDVNVEVDGLPVNMVSHAHGQGYADLHFLIPELVSYVDFDKGPYFADKGDFNTAGYVAFHTRNRLDRNFMKLEGGSFGALRTVGGWNIPMKSETSQAYIAGEFSRYDGFFVHNQDFNRFNIQAKWSKQLNKKSQLSAAWTTFSSQWDASGQIPDRAVAEGIITRYGSLDPTEGGKTGRTNAFVKLSHQFDNGSSWENQLYAVRYDFSLYSNFTFYLNDPVQGDQIRQREQRWIYGYKTSYHQASTLWGKDLKTEAGGGFRYDVVNDIGLSHTVKRVFLNDIKLGDIREGNAHGYVSETLSLTDKLSLNAALRFDYFYFSYNDRLCTLQPAAVGKGVVSPKLNINYQVASNVELFIRSGSGFHSNDARVVVAQTGRDVLPKAYSADAGANIKVTPQLLLHTALWRLDLAQEFVYVGDEGIVEPSGKTKREGVDLSVRQQINSWLFLDADLNWTRPRSKGEPAGQNYIPLAPNITSIGGISFRRQNGLNGSLRYRYLGDRPANEDNTVIAKGYCITDAVLNYSRPGFEVGMSAENIFNRQWNEAQFDTESRLQNEEAPVSEIHFTPGTPFSLKVRLVKYF